MPCLVQIPTHESFYATTRSTQIVACYESKGFLSTVGSHRWPTLQPRAGLTEGVASSWKENLLRGRKRQREGGERERQGTEIKTDIKIDMERTRRTNTCICRQTAVDRYMEHAMKRHTSPNVSLVDACRWRLCRFGIHVLEVLHIRMCRNYSSNTLSL